MHIRWQRCLAWVPRPAPNNHPGHKFWGLENGYIMHGPSRREVRGGRFNIGYMSSNHHRRHRYVDSQTGNQGGCRVNFTWAYSSAHTLAASREFREFKVNSLDEVIYDLYSTAESGEQEPQLHITCSPDFAVLLNWLLFILQFDRLSYKDAAGIACKSPRQSPNCRPCPCCGSSSILSPSSALPSGAQ